MSFKECDADIKFIAELLPRFDGNPKLLNHYIREVEHIIKLMNETSSSHPAFICLIKSKLSGAAIDAIAYEESLATWDLIKNALVRRLGEPRNEIQVMQELTRTRRNKNEDAESFGRRLRETLDTLYSVGKHANRSYYEEMVIEQYINQLDFHVSLGVRIARPGTLESAIVAARQEEARLTHNRQNYVAPSTSLVKQKDISRGPPQSSFQYRNFRGSQPLAFQPQTQAFHQPQPNFVPQQNNMTPEQRQQWVQSMLPWKNRTSNNARAGNASNLRTGNSGNFRGSNSGNFRQFNVPQQVNLPQKSSDVTMRSVSKPEKPQFAVEELYYSQNHTQDQSSFNGEPYNSYYPQEECDFAQEEDQQPEADFQQDFYMDRNQEDQS